jgi:enediyne biosynthesis protein E4
VKRISLLILSTLVLLFGCEKKNKTLFTHLSPSTSGINFENTIVESPQINILTYEYTYNGGGVAAGDFNNDGLCDLYFTGNAVKNRLYLNRGNLQFKDITEQANVAGRNLWKTGVTTADVNGDGWLDIYVCYSGPDAGQSLSNELYINNGAANGEPTFTERAKEYGLDAPNTYSTQASFFDYDRDGDLDMFLINHGNFFYTPFVNTHKLRNMRHPRFGNRLYRNEVDSLSGKGKNAKHYFTDVSQQANILGGGINFSLGVSISDVNSDGWPDIFVTNDYEEQDYLYLNDTKGAFIESTKKSFDHLSRNSMGSDIADYNNDGKTDLIEVDMWPEDNFRQKLLRGPDDYQRYQLMLDSGFHHQQMRNTLQLNTGNDKNGVPLFSEIGQLSGVSSTDWSWAPLLVDVDNDGYKDLFVTNGYLRDFTSMDFLKYTVEEAKRKAQQSGKQLELYKLVSQMSSTKTSDYLFRNNGDLTFSDCTKEWGVYAPNLSFGSTYADLDNDGDLELITNNTNEKATVWENHSSDKQDNNYLSVKLKGTKNNLFAIGAKVYLKTGDQIQLQEMIATRGFQSSVEPLLHFGLGKNKSVDEIKVVWPDGKKSIVNKVKGNQVIELVYSNVATDLVPKEKNQPTLFKDVSAESNVRFVHHENNFVDFNRETLLPYQLSRSGPPLASGDVNRDGLDDFYIGGAAGQSGQLYMGDGAGHFNLSRSQPWKADAEKEDTGAVFFDVDNDKDLDLFVVSGGSEFVNGAKELEDRLYLNNGNGIFLKAPAECTMVDHVNGSCVAAADYDKDGDIDLFVGGASLPGQFPLPSPGAILRNDRDPLTHQFKLTVATKEVNADLRELGMVTDALWTDFNGDGWPDLMVVGHWMPIRLFENKKGKLIEVHNKVLANSTGLWNRITSADMDRDGDMDYVLGNAGVNLPWKVSPQEPMTLLFGDFNHDHQLDPIISAYTNGKSYPIASRDELLLQLNSLRKNFTDYASYGKATMDDIGKWLDLKDAKKLSVENLCSSFLENLGGNDFRLSPLPIQAQFSCVNSLLAEDFTGDGVVDVLVAGNFYPYRTQYGPSDAGTGLLLQGNGKGHFTPITFEAQGFLASGEVRGMMALKGNSKIKYLVVARNNDAVMVFNYDMGGD